MRGSPRPAPGKAASLKSRLLSCKRKFSEKRVIRDSSGAPELFSPWLLRSASTMVQQ